MSKRVCILNYGSGNVRSVFNLLHHLGVDVTVSNEPSVVQECSHLVLPGVGAFGAAMKKIRAMIPMDVVEHEVMVRQKPILGICVGMQVMATKGTEFGEFDGLGWIPGSVSQLASNQLPLPHIGWNNVHVDPADPLFREMNTPEGIDFYFLHSFAFTPEDDRHAIASAEYGSRFASAVRKDNIYGVQFHPEKSQRAGQKLFKNFLDLT